MKNLKYILLVLIATLWTSCDFEDELTEVPKDFLSPEISFVNKSGFESGLANIYLSIRNSIYTPGDGGGNYDMLAGYDVDYLTIQKSNTVYNEYFRWNTVSADMGFSRKWWGKFYNWIYQANVLIDRSESDVVKWNSEDEKNAIVAEAKFLRAFSYHFLGNMWGGVPLVLHETTEPKFDFTRASQDDVYNQCKSDLEFAIQYLPTIDKIKGGRACKAAAYHLLSEVLISLGDYQGAIDAASSVIDNSNFSLMTERFGVREDFTFNGYDYQGPEEPWGDVYWDLFRIGNMNWQEGNHEAIWNIEMDHDIPGGGNTKFDAFRLERHAYPDWWREKDINGVSNWLMDELNGRPNGSSVPTDYAGNLIWQYKGDWDRDIRNSKYNIQRVYYWTNPESEFYGEPITLDNVADQTTFTKLCAPGFKKFIPVFHYGNATDPASGQNHDNGWTFHDWYIMRLSETYLLRAEAYLRKGDLTNAAADINAIRTRAQATPVTEGDVNIDLILDERARELFCEEFRINTLMRTDKLVEHLMKYNPTVVRNGYNLPEYLNKLPIPQAEIEANKEAELTQNPGY